MNSRLEIGGGVPKLSAVDEELEAPEADGVPRTSAAVLMLRTVME